jgi:hypothetical protein
MPRRQWLVEFHSKCEVWADGLEQADAEALLAAVADARFDEHQAALNDEESAGQRPAGRSGRSKKKRRP